jgi:membrane protein
LHEKLIVLSESRTASTVDAGNVVARGRGVLFVPFDVHLSWRELFKRTVREVSDDDCFGLAAQLSYYFFLALFPAVLFFLAVASFFPIANLNDELLRTLGPVAAPDVLRFLEEQLVRLSNADSGGILTIGFLGTVWSSSAAVVAIIGSLNRAYDIEEGRPWWKVRLIAIALTFALAIFMVVSFMLILAGPTLAESLARNFGLGPVFEWGWKILQWPLAFALVSTAIGLVYFFAPDAEQEWVWITPGAIVGTVLWILVSLGFKVYVTNFADYNATYGALGGVMALLLWFYISGLAILVGAEMNAEIEHASPHGKAPGEKVPGQRRKIGLAAARAYQAWQALRSRAATAIPKSDRPPAATPAAMSAAVHAMEDPVIMAPRQDDRSLGEMFSELSRDFQTLMHQEFQLARLELTEKAARMRRGLVFMIGGGLLAYGGFLAVIAGIVLGLIAAGLPAWLGAFLAGVVLAGLGYLFIHWGMTSLRPKELTPHHTIDTLKEDAQWLRTQTK